MFHCQQTTLEQKFGDMAPHPFSVDSFNVEHQRHLRYFQRLLFDNFNRQRKVAHVKLKGSSA